MVGAAGNQCSWAKVSLRFHQFRSVATKRHMDWAVGKTRGTLFLVDFRISRPQGRLEHAFQKKLELADFRLHGKRTIRNLPDINGKQAFEAESFQGCDDPGIIHLSLANRDLELVWTRSGVPQVNVPRQRYQGIKRFILVGPDHQVAWVKGQAKTRQRFHQFFRTGDRFGGCVLPGWEAKLNPFGLGDLVIGRKALT